MVKKKGRRKKIQRVSTGIEGLDKLIVGGFKKNSINIAAGSTGSGKSIFGTQFLTNNLPKGEKSLYITFEENKKEFYSNMLGIGIDLEKLEQEKKFFFLEYTPQKVKRMLEEGGGEVESIILQEKIDRVVIDSITSFMLLFEKDIDIRKAILSLFNMLRKWSCTALLTYEGHVNENVKTNVLEIESDSIILLHLTKTPFRRKRELEILKMRGTKHPTKLYKCKIGKKGFRILS